MPNIKSSEKPAPHHSDGDRHPIDSAHDLKAMGQDVVEFAVQYAKEKPTQAALWCLGLGFVIGWKLKP